jgi:hypothetical protein
MTAECTRQKLGPAMAMRRREAKRCIILITNFRRAAVASAYNPTAFQILEAIMADKDRIQGSAEQGKVQNELKDALRSK